MTLFPGTHLGIGPAISDGFYYDFERAESFAEGDLPKIEQKMRELIGAESEIRAEHHFASRRRSTISRPGASISRWS